MNELSKRWLVAGDAFTAWYLHKGLTQAAVARRAKVSAPILRRIEAGEVHSYRKLGSIEKAIGWPEGTFNAILKGADPPALPRLSADGGGDDPAMRALAATVTNEISRLTARLEQLSARLDRLEGSTPAAPPQPPSGTRVRAAKKVVG